MRADMLFDMSGRVALVTGAASGIGLAIVDVLSANGALVVMADVNVPDLTTHVARLQGEQRRVEALPLDVADVLAVEREVDALVERHGRLDAAFANAGITGGPGFGAVEGGLAHVDWTHWERVMRINLDGAFATARAAAIHMRRARRGSIVVTSSVAALRASHLPSLSYHASKAAIAQVVRVMALELGPDNVRINAIAPGPFATNIAGARLQTEAGAARFASTVPLGRVAATQEIMGLALLLASDASSYMTGSIIPIDGGTQA